MQKSLLSINNYHYLRGGAEKVFLDHNELMKEVGWRVAPFSMHGEKNLPSEWSSYFVKEIEFGESYSTLQKMVNAVKIIHSYEAKQQIAKLVQDFRPSIAHGHNIYHHLSTSILSALRAHGVPVVLTLHDLKIACPAYTMLSHGKICEKCKGGGIHNVFTNKCMKDSTLLSGLIMVEAYFNQLFGMYKRNVNRYVVPSQFYIDKFVEWGFPRHQFVHIPNYVELKESHPKCQVGNYFVYAGRLSKEKGLITLVKAAAAQGSRLIIAGSGPEELHVKKLSSELGASHVEFAGYLDKQALSELVAGCRAVIVPSEWYENCPMSIIEAFAAGKVVIGSDIGGISEMIEEGVDGFKFKMGSSDQLAGLMNQVARMTEDTLVEMGGKAVEKVRTHYSKEQYLEKTLQLYSEIIS